MEVCKGIPQNYDVIISSTAIIGLQHNDKVQHNYRLSAFTVESDISCP